MSNYVSKREYVNTFGPTVGDRVRLADTDLFIEVERDLTTYGGTHYGDEVKFGGGKVIRDGMGQSPISNADGAVDLVITNILILDWWGIVKADVGIKDGRIAEIGKAGNPHTQDEIDFLYRAFGEDFPIGTLTPEALLELIARTYVDGDSSAQFRITPIAVQSLDGLEITPEFRPGAMFSDFG